MAICVAGLKADPDRVAALDLEVLPALRRYSRCLPHRSVSASDPVLDAALPGCMEDRRRVTLRKRYGEPMSRPLARVLDLHGRTDLVEQLRTPEHRPDERRRMCSFSSDRIRVLWDEEQDLQDRASEIATYAEHALATFEALGLAKPREMHAGGPLTIVLVHLEGRLGETDPGWSHIEIDPALSGAEAGGVVAHEIFHRIEYSYNDTADMSGFYAAIREGGARLAQQCALFSGSAIQDGYLDMPAAPLMRPDTIRIEPHSYSASLFWQYLCEQYGKRQVVPAGFDAFIRVLEATRDGYTLENLRRVTADLAGGGTFDEFSRFGDDIRSTETTWGNFLVANWLSGTTCQPLDRRFVHGGRVMPPPPSHSALVEALIHPDRRPVRFARAQVPPYSASYYQLEFGSDTPKLLRFSFEAQHLEGNGTGPLTQLLLMDAQNRLVDIVRIDDWRWERVIATGKLERVMVIAAAREAACSFSLQVEAAASQPLVAITRWNCDPGYSYERDPSVRPWDWRSPDLEVALAGQDLVVNAYARNAGDQRAEVTARFSWQPVGNLAGSSEPGLWESGAALSGTGWQELGTAPSTRIESGDKAMIRFKSARPDARGWIAVRAQLEVAGASQDAAARVAISLIHAGKEQDERRRG